jgi:glycosyltransferase involved in cell wall biosynthesis
MVLHVVIATLGVASFVTLAYWSVGLGRLLVVRRALPTAAAGARLERAKLRACVVVPAHNEAQNIGLLLDSLRRQDHDDFSVVLALDRCTDDTLPRAREAIDSDPRFEIIEIDDCPDGWAGKVHAIREGVHRSANPSTCDVLLFVDADVSLSPECLRATLALLESRRLDVLTLVPNVTMKSWWDWAVQPVAGFELLRQYPLIRTNTQGCKKPFVNGQFLMIRREAYEQIGGHDAVHDQMLEDLAIGRRAGEAGLRCGAFFAAGLASCRMYDTWEEFKRGWSRIYAEAARRRVSRLGRAGVHVRAFGAVLPLAAVVCLGVVAGSIGAVPMWLTIAAGSVAAASLGMFVCVIGGSFRTAGLPWRSVTAYPFGAWLVGRVLHASARMVRRRQVTTWANREYQLAPR